MSKILKSFGMAALLVALLAGTGMGQDDVVVSGDLNETYVITAPDDFAFNIDGKFVFGDNNKTDLNLNVKNNYLISVQVAGGADRMTSPAAATLTEPLYLHGDDTTDTTVTTTAVTIITNKAASDTDYEIAFGQHVLVTDTPDDTGPYAMTVTFSVVP